MSSEGTFGFKVQVTRIRTPEHGQHSAIQQSDLARTCVTPRKSTAVSFRMTVLCARVTIHRMSWSTVSMMTHREQQTNVRTQGHLTRHGKTISRRLR